MGITMTFDAPYFTGSGLSSLVPGMYPVSLNGRNYLVSMKPEHGFSKQSIPLLRDQADTGNVPGEQTISPKDLWRRAQDNWTHGAGQLYLDRIDPDVQTFHSNRGSDSTRFNRSKGIDPWTRWQASLLADTTQVVSSVNTNLNLVSVGTYWYYIDGTSLRYKTDLTAGGGTAVTGTPAATPTSIATDGYNVWVAYGANGIYGTTRGAAAATQIVSTALNSTAIVGYVNGRLMVGFNNALYNVTNLVGPAALPAALFTQANTDFVWTAFGEGPSALYAAGYSGDRSIIYKTALKTDATALDAPTVAAPLPDGEIARSLQGYLGFLAIGTDKGVRVGDVDISAGNVTIGSYIPTTTGVYCFEPQDRFVWFGWNNYDTTSTGLGRLDLTEFTSTLTPAYASDLMVTGQGQINAIATFANKRVFAISGLGIYTESANRVSSGTLDTGLMTFGLPDAKVGMYLDLRYKPLVGTVKASISADRGSFTTLGFDAIVNATGVSLPVGQVTAEVFEVRIELDRSGTDATTGPTLTRLTFRAYPAPNRNEIVTLPLVLFEDETLNNVRYSMNPQSELTAIRGMIKAHQLVSYQEGTQSYSAFVDDYQWVPDSQTNDRSFWNGICVTKLTLLNQ